MPLVNIIPCRQLEDVVQLDETLRQLESRVANAQAIQQRMHEAEEAANKQVAGRQAAIRG
jgi:hypothetical protein